MKPQDAKQVFNVIKAHIDEQGGPYRNWYCGITSDWEDRLFTEHNVPRKDYWRIARQCYKHEDARTVEKDLCELGCDGGPGGGDKTTVYVYAYLKGTMTHP